MGLDNYIDVVVQFCHDYFDNDTTSCPTKLRHAGLQLLHTQSYETFTP